MRAMPVFREECIQLVLAVGASRRARPGLVFADFCGDGVAGGTCGGDGGCSSCGSRCG